MPSVTNEPNLPPIAADADDLKAIKNAVDDAAAVGGGLWLSYLFVLFYLAVAAGAVTHADLFFENPVKLPFLNIELPLLAFFFLAPILFLIVHAYTLVHLVMLSACAAWLDGRRGGRRRGRAYGRACGKADGRRADHRDEPPQDPSAVAASHLPPRAVATPRPFKAAAPQRPAPRR